MDGNFGYGGLDVPLALIDVEIGVDGFEMFVAPREVEAVRIRERRRDVLEVARGGADDIYIWPGEAVEPVAPVRYITQRCLDTLGVEFGDVGVVGIDVRRAVLDACRRERVGIEDKAATVDGEIGRASCRGGVGV